MSFLALEVDATGSSRSESESASFGLAFHVNTAPSRLTVYI